jgi:hypothetical protein
VSDSSNVCPTPASVTAAAAVENPFAIPDRGSTMRRMTPVDQSRTECLRRAREYDWLGDNSPTEEGAAYGFDQARLWRSRALVARPDEEPINEKVHSGR